MFHGIKVFTRPGNKKAPAVRGFHLFKCLGLPGIAGSGILTPQHRTLPASQSRIASWYRSTRQ